MFQYLLLYLLELFTVDILRQQYRSYLPVSFTRWLIRFVLVLPPSLARMTIYHLSKPLASQQTWIKLFNNHHWKGAIIAPDIMTDTDETALDRLMNADLVIYEVHGGGFRVGHCVMYMDAFISWLTILKETHGINAVIMSVEYGLAPKVHYPGPVIECANAYRYLTGKLGVSPSKIIVSGDSAGGIISLEMLCHIYAPGLLTNPMAQRTNDKLDPPAGILLSSPLISVNQTSDTWKRYVDTDLVSSKLFDLVLKEYIQLSINPLDKLAMLHLYNNLTLAGGMAHICRGGVLFFVGETEVFSQDIYDFADLIRQQTSLKVDLYKAPLPHDWYVIRDIVHLKDMSMVQHYDDLMAKWCYQRLCQHVDPISETMPLWADKPSLSLDDSRHPINVVS
ncbi:Alpha/Beta hydrolase protein [Chlamydoabsidia padenii]|nr:Alpha/Beta hydrolase protein [Chlamydoabsidia padenii]